MITNEELPQVLFVDDEVNLLQSLSRQVRGYVIAELATSPLEAIELLRQAARGEGGPTFAAVVTDMRMPVMDGTEFLRQARGICPNTTRLLLTGFADVDSAIAAVNEGSVFRFLTKPCSTVTLRSALSDAIEYHRLVNDKNELLERTLRGAVGALIETLAMADPAAFARASRLGRLTYGIASQLGMPDAWKVEVATTLGQIGAISLPPEALEALAVGRSSDPVISEMINELPALAGHLLGRIPRLEDIREIVRTQEPVESPNAVRLSLASRAALIVQAVREYDAFINRGYSPEHAIKTLQSRGHHSPDILEALRSVVTAFHSAEVAEIDIRQLRPGQVLAADLRAKTGMLLVAHGHALTEEMLARIRNFARLAGLADQPVIIREKNSTRR